MREIKVILVVLALMLFLFRVFVSGQSYKIDRIYLNLGLNTMAGVSYGIGETLVHHHSSSVFSSADETSFWGSQSWLRKYRNYPLDTRAKFPGAKTILAWTQDGYHASRTTQRVLMNVSTVMYRPPRKKWHKIVDFAILQLGFSAGFHLSQLILRR